MKTKQYHILKVISFTFLITIITSCSSSNEKIKEGNYIASNKLSTLALYYNKYILGISLFSVGDTLTIYDNKDFRYRTCGSNMFGKYRIKKDMLFLDVDSAITHFDKKVYSENFIDTFFIKSENQLEQLNIVKNTRESKETYKSITRLFYVIEEKK